MITLRPDSQAFKIIKLLSLTGEFPFHSLHLLGNDQAMRKLIRNLTEPQVIRNPDNDERLMTRLLTVSGKGIGKSIRLYRRALPILNWLHPNAYSYYMNSFYGHRLPGDEAHRIRNHRIAESAAMLLNAGVIIEPYRLPCLQNKHLLDQLPEYPGFYFSRDLKKIGDGELNKTKFTRITGALFYSGGCYAVYNTRSTRMKWNGMGEFKTLYSLTEIARMNSGIQNIDSAVLFGESGDIALDTCLESEQKTRSEFRFDGIYRHVYFLPLGQDGARRLRILCMQNWKEKILNILFDPATRSYDQGAMEYDAFINGTCVYSHLDGDLARLIRFREALRFRKCSCEVICFPDQVSLLREYLEPDVKLKIISLDLLESELSMTERESDET